MTAVLLDANVLIALTIAEHEHHDRVCDWLSGVRRFAVCPVVEGALVRFLLRIGESGNTAHRVVTSVRQHPHCEFWPDDVSFDEVHLSDLHGHRQVTDAYLAALACANESRLATLDKALALLRPQHVLLLP